MVYKLLILKRVLSIIITTEKAAMELEDIK